MKKHKKVRPSRLANLSTAIAQDCLHANSATTASEMRVLQFEVTEVDRSIVALRAALANQTARRARIEATLRGMSAVLGSRKVPIIK